MLRSCYAMRASINKPTMRSEKPSNALKGYSTQDGHDSSKVRAIQPMTDDLVGLRLLQDRCLQRLSRSLQLLKS